MPNITKYLRTNRRPASLTACPCGPEGLTYPAYWYRLPGVEGFFICTKCYEDKLANSQFAGLLETFHNEPLPGTKSICDFNSPRVDLILTKAIKTCDTGPLFSYAEHRSNIAPCDGLSGTRGGYGNQWFSNPELPGFVACEACFEDVISATSFAQKFSAHPEQHPTDENWICDLAMPYIKRSLIDFSISGDWYGFVTAANYRLSIPVCDPSPVVLTTRKWFRPIRPWPIQRLMICEACYLDYAGSPQLAPNFTRVHPKFTELQDLVICSFKNKPIQAYSEQLLKENYGRWHHLVNQIVMKPSCANGDIDGEWYTMPDPKNSSRNITNFDICSACHLGFIESTGHASAFRQIIYPEGATRVCDFSPITPRFPRYMQKWMQMVFTGDASPLADYATRITKISQCSRSANITKARWWGMDEFFFCAECYEEVGKGSFFAPTFNYQGTVFPEGRCDMYTENMRCRYLEACRQRSLDEFMNYCRFREEIWQLMKQEVQRHKMAVKMTERANSQSTLLTISSFPVENSNALVPMRPDLAKHRRVSAPAKIHYDNRVTEENLKRAQRRAIKESMMRSPTLIHLQARWNEVE